MKQANSSFAGMSKMTTKDDSGAIAEVEDDPGTWFEPPGKSEAEPDEIVESCNPSEDTGSSHTPHHRDSSTEWTKAKVHLGPGQLRVMPGVDDVTASTDVSPGLFLVVTGLIRLFLQESGHTQGEFSRIHILVTTWDLTRSTRRRLPRPRSGAREPLLLLASSPSCGRTARTDSTIAQLRGRNVAGTIACASR